MQQKEDLISSLEQKLLQGVNLINLESIYLELESCLVISLQDQQDMIQKARSLPGNNFFTVQLHEKVNHESYLSIVEKYCLREEEIKILNKIIDINFTGQKLEVEIKGCENVQYKLPWFPKGAGAREIRSAMIEYFIKFVLGQVNIQCRAVDQGKWYALIVEKNSALVVKQKLKAISNWTDSCAEQGNNSYFLLNHEQLMQVFKKATQKEFHREWIKEDAIRFSAIMPTDFNTWRILSELLEAKRDPEDLGGMPIFINKKT